MIALAAALALAACQEPAGEPARKLPLRFGGRLHADWTAAGGADLGAIGAARGEPVEDGGEVRRARLRADWTLAPGWRFRADYDFARGDTRPREVALLWSPARGEEWKAGFVKLSSGFENRMSSNDLDLVEEPLAEQALLLGRRTGLFHARWTPEWTAGGGAYLLADSRARVDRGTWGAQGRAAWRPWRDQDGGLLHLGVAASWEDPDGAASFAATPGHHVLGEFLDSGKIPTDPFARFGLELAGAEGPFFGLAEWSVALPDHPAGGTAALQGWTLSLGGFLTGERRSYDDARASWGGTTPLAPFDPADPGAGPGAWELVARAQRLGLDGVAGPGAADALDAYSAGFVWHWTANLRWMCTLSRIELDGFDAIHAVTIRMSVDF